MISAIVFASIAVFFAGTAGWLWSRPQFDMVKTLADLAAHEGTWDNPWDLQDKKIASLEADIKAEVSPINARPAITSEFFIATPL